MKFIQARLQKWVGTGLTVTEINVRPTHLSVKGIQYVDPVSKQKFAQIEEMRVYPGLLSPIRGFLKIREWSIHRPLFFFYRSWKGDLIGPLPILKEGEKKQEISDSKEKESEGSFRIEIDRFRIEGGSIDFEDKKTEGPPAKIELRELNLEIKSIQYPMVSIHSPIELKGKMKGKTKDGSIDAKGWINFNTMDMETSLRVQDIELKIFEPYYRKRVSAEIEAGDISMEAEIAIQKKRIDAPGQLEVSNLHIKEGGGTILWIPAKVLVSLLKDKGNRIKVRFHVKGNIDDPRFNFQETFLTRIGLSLAEALGIPIRVVGETLLEGTGKGAEGLIEGFKSIEQLFKKKKEKKK